MSDENDHSRHHVTENYKPDAPKNYRPETLPSHPHPTGHGVDGNYVPPTDSAPATPPPKPKK